MGDKEINCRKLANIKSLKRFLPLYVMMIPGMAYLIINNYIPICGLVVAFKNVNFSLGIFNSPWCGLDNFKYLFLTDDAWVITRNTLVYNTVFLAVNTLLSVATAIFLSELCSRRRRRFFQSVILLPYLISIIIVSYLVNAFLKTDTGFINRSILPLLGMEPIEWYLQPKYWPFILIFVNAWKNVGYTSIIYFSTVIGIDTELYEAANLDGATTWKRIRYITLPLLKPTVIIMVLLAVGKIFNADFGLFYQVPMNMGSLYSVTNVIDTYVYRGLLTLGDVGMSSAAGFYQSIVGFLVVFSANLLVRKMDPDYALF